MAEKPTRDTSLFETFTYSEDEAEGIFSGLALTPEAKKADIISALETWARTALLVDTYVKARVPLPALVDEFEELCNRIEALRECLNGLSIHTRALLKRSLHPYPKVITATRCLPQEQVPEEIKDALTKPISSTLDTELRSLQDAAEESRTMLWWDKGLIHQWEVEILTAVLSGSQAPTNVTIGPDPKEDPVPRGRPREYAARQFVQACAVLYWRCTGNRPTVNTHPDSGERYGAFYDFVVAAIRPTGLHSGVPTELIREAAREFRKSRQEMEQSTPN